jgi:hypothetical protein
MQVMKNKREHLAAQPIGNACAATIAVAGFDNYDGRYVRGSEGLVRGSQRRSAATMTWTLGCGRY